MIFRILKILLITLLAVLNGNLTFCNPDYQSVNYNTPFSRRGRIKLINQTPVANWYAYDFTTQKNSIRPEYNHFELKPSGMEVNTKNPWVRYKFEEIKERNNDTIREGETDGINNSSPYNSNDKQQIPGIRSNMHGDGKPVDINSTRNLGSVNEPIRKSESKCEEYGRAVGRKVWALLLVGTNPQGIPVSTGSTRCEGLHTPLIVGGTKVQPDEFPHMAALGWYVDGEIQYLCGGSLIAEQWVLTAAHCTHGHSGSPAVVRLGTHLLSDNNLGQSFEIESIWRHPTYKPPAMYADIALLALKNSVRFNEHIRPACLHQQFDAAPPKAWATGWGVTQIGDDNSDTLLKAQLDVLDNVNCARQYNRSAAVPRGIVPSMVCAGDSSGDWQSDTCQGDSGGPLQVIHPTINCLYQVVGITSFGKLCALRDTPGIYTRVSQYLDWIEAIVWSETAN